MYFKTDGTIWNLEHGNIYITRGFAFRKTTEPLQVKDYISRGILLTDFKRNKLIQIKWIPLLL